MPSLWRRAAAAILPVLVLFNAPNARAETSLWVETPGVMIMPDRAAGTVKAIATTGFGNATSVAQLALRSDQPGPFSFEWTELKGAAGKVIAKSDISLFRAADIEVAKTSHENRSKDPLRGRPLGMFPDALVPLIGRDGSNVANTIKPEKDKTTAFWVDILVPAATPAGQYTGGITLKSGDAALQIPVKVIVYNAGIPADSTIPSLYNLRDHPHVRANIENYVAETMAHRLQPTNYHYADLQPDFIDKYNPNGKGFASVYFWDTQPSAKIADNLKRITAHLKEKKLFENSFLQLKDEPGPQEIPGLIEVAKAVLRNFPEWKGKIVDTLSSKEGTELDSYVTFHVKPPSLYGPWSWTKHDGREEWDKRRADGQQLWFYISNSQGTPYPTFDIDTPNLAFEPRVMPWAWWFEKATGHLYWDLMFEPKWKLNPGFPPGDGQLMFPGDFTLPGAPAWAQIKDLKGPVVSRRMKSFRQGLEEWELLRIAEKKFGREKIQPIVAKVYTCMGQKDPAAASWSYDEAAWDKARVAVLDLFGQ